MSDKENIEFKKSSGNLFADLGLEDAQEQQARSLIGIHVLKLLKEKKADKTQTQMGEMLGLKPAEVSHLFNGHFSRFSTDRLLSLLEILDQKVTIRISPRKQGEPYHEVAFA